MRSHQCFGVMAVGLVLLFSGCAHTATEKKLDQKLAEQSAVKSSSELGLEADQMINSAVGLTAEQRTQLVLLRETTRKEMDQLRDESLKLRVVLIKDVVSKQYESKEVSLIKKRIKKVENKRLQLIFGAIDKANKILGREAVQNQIILNQFIDERGHT